jgi:DNA-binding transcriptional LysR family regulator
MRRLTLKQLQTVRAVAQSGTIATAADILRVTPAALTARIKLLEGDVGLAFFDRAGGRLRLTDAGQEVVNTTVRMEMLLVELGNTLAALKGKHAGRVSVGVISTAKYFAPRLIAAFTKENPRIDLALSIGNRQETIKLLRDYAIDIALMGQPPADFPVISQVIGQHPQVVIAPLDHPLVGRRNIDKADLAEENFIVREDGSGTRRVFDYFFGGVAVRQPTIKFEIASNETIKQAVMAGLGLSLISAHTIDAEVAAGRLAVLDVKGLPIVRQWFLVRRANWTPTPVGEAIWDFATKHAADFMPGTAQVQELEPA